MAKAIHGRISDPTANIALARCFRQGLPKPKIQLVKIKRELEHHNEKWIVWVSHRYHNYTTVRLYDWWCREGTGHFIDWLERCQIIYRKHKVEKTK